eukprot:707286-Hanusia_phi.AAC.1
MAYTNLKHQEVAGGGAQCICRSALTRSRPCQGPCDTVTVTRSVPAGVPPRSDPGRLVHSLTAPRPTELRGETVNRAPPGPGASTRLSPARARAPGPGPGDHRRRIRGPADSTVTEVGPHGD